MLNIEKYKGNILNAYQSDITCCVIDLFHNGVCPDNCKDCKKYAMKWLLEEYKGPVLDEVEIKYLSEVIRPFRNEVTYIKKDCTDKYFIVIAMKHDCSIYLPTFPVDSSMYKGMEVNRKYKLEELGL